MASCNRAEREHSTFKKWAEINVKKTEKEKIKELYRTVELVDMGGGVSGREKEKGTIRDRCLT